MKKPILFVAVGLAVAMMACGGAGKKSADSAVAENNKEMVAADASAPLGKGLVKNGLPVIVDFSAEWCPPCRKLKPIFTELKGVYAGKVDFVTVNVDSMPELSQDFRVESIPALIYLNAEGEEIYRSFGFQTGEQIKSDISKYFSK